MRPLGRCRYLLDGTDPSDQVYLASFPGGHAGTIRHILKKVMPAAIDRYLGGMPAPIRRVLG